MALSPAAGHANNPRVVMKDLEELREAKLHTALRFLESKQTGLSPSILHACMHACMHALRGTLRGACLHTAWRLLHAVVEIPHISAMEINSWRQFLVGSLREYQKLEVCMYQRCVHTCIRIQGRQRIGVVLYAYHTRAPAHFREYHELEVSRSGGATAPPLGLDGVDLISSSFRFGFRF